MDVPRGRHAPTTTARHRWPLFAALALILPLVMPVQPAEASHLRAYEASIAIDVADDERSATVQVTGIHRSNLSWIFQESAYEIYPPDATSDDSGRISDYTDVTVSDAFGSGIDETVESFTIDLTDDAGDPITGRWTVSAENCCRISVSGIQNISNNRYSVEAGFLVGPNSDNERTEGPPFFDTTIRTTVSVGDTYQQDLGAVDPDGTNVTYQLLGPDDLGGQDYDDWLTLDESSGLLTVASSVTDTWSDGDNYVVKVRVTDGDGEYVDREVMLTAVDLDADQSPPSISGIDDGDEFDVAPGDTLEIDITAEAGLTDDGSSALDVELSGGPVSENWAELQPGTDDDSFTIVVTPPASQAGLQRSMNLEATETFEALQLTTNYQVIINVLDPEGDADDPVVAPAPQPTPPPAPTPDEDGQLPVLTPGTSLTLIDGQRSGDVTADADQLVPFFSDGDFDITVWNPGPRAEATPDAVADGDELRLTQGGQVALSVEGFAPFTDVHLWMFSEPQLVGSFTTDGDGRLVAELGDVPDELQPCRSTIQVQGDLSDGREVAANVGAWILAAPFPFGDVVTTDRHATGIGCLEALDVVQGVVTDGPIGAEYRPESSLTRGQAVTMIARSLGAADTAPAPFTDTQGSAHESAIAALAREDVVQGRADGTFGVDDAVTRGQLTALMARAMGLDADTGVAGFADTDGHTHGSAIAALVGAGVIDGYADGTFRPDALITRAETASIIARSFDLFDRDDA